LLGLLMAGLLKAWLPEGMLQQKLGHGRFLPILKATLIGAPLPLCSCGVLPAAMGLRRSGTSKSATVSFMSSTPETGPDSIAVTYALLGPFMALVRPVAAVFSALVTGLLTLLFVPQEEAVKPTINLPVSKGGDAAVTMEVAVHRRMDRIPGLGSVRATASTPLAAAMILAGVSPGTVLVFLLAGPATNLATMGVIHREMGLHTLLSYLLGISLSSITLGLLTDHLIHSWNISLAIGDISNRHEAIEWISVVSGVVLFYLSVGSLVRWCRVKIARW
jgi:uncharacterized membrane protein YraQ (UPF0718 family)